MSEILELGRCWISVGLTANLPRNYSDLSGDSTSEVPMKIENSLDSDDIVPNAFSAKLFFTKQPNS